MPSETDMQNVLDAMRQTNGSKAKAARLLGWTRSRLRRFCKSNRIGGAAPAAGASESAPNLTIVKQQDEIRTLKNELRANQRADLTAQQVREDILKLSASDPNPPSWVAKGAVGASDPGIPTLGLGDWHWSEEVDPISVRGFNEYNIRTQNARARAMFNKARHLALDCIVHTKDYPGIVVCLGGDMLSGDIHEELSETNTMPMFPALLDLRGVLIWLIDNLIESFGRVFVVGVPGNHPRTTMKARAKQQVVMNCDWLLYQLIEAHYNDTQNQKVKFHFPTDTEAAFKIFDHRYLLVHGDQLGARGGDGMIGSIGPLMRGDFKVRRSVAGMGYEYDTLICNHWHQAMRLDGIMCNGSLKGYCEYAKKIKAKPELPKQLFWFTRPDGSIVWDSPIVLNDRKQKPTIRPWVSWEAE